MDRLKKLLIIKTGAAGDVLRTTPLLRSFREWEIHWLTASENRDLLDGATLDKVMVQPAEVGTDSSYDLVISLEDDADLLRAVFSRIRATRVFGSHPADNDGLTYSADANEWFDMSLISRFGRKRADELKLKNRDSYQSIIFRGLGLRFSGERYIMPEHLPHTGLKGDIAVAPKAGARWPIKNWHYFDRLIEDLSRQYSVNVLPMRSTLLEHVADVRGHRFLISGDSLPMHIAIGYQIPSVAIFTCTSPWEIHGYELLTKVVSSKLEQYFYSREFDLDAVTALTYEEVFDVVSRKLAEFKI